MKQTILEMQERMKTAAERMPTRLPAKAQPPLAQEAARSVLLRVERIEPVFPLYL